MEIMGNNVINALGILSLLLLIGFWIRTKVTILQKLFLPASLIGGTIGLIVLQGYYLFIGSIDGSGHDIQQNVQEIVRIFTRIPGVLIVPITAAIPLGLRILGHEKNGSKLSYIYSILPMFAIFGLITSFQYFFGLLSGIMFGSNEGAIYKTAGLELMVGFSGGHGIAGFLGNKLNDLEANYWQISQAMGISVATVGIVFGIIIGTTFINIAARRNMLTYLSKPSSIPAATLKGYELNKDLQKPLANEITSSSAINSIAFHIAIIFTVVMFASFIKNFSKEHDIIILKSLSSWSIAILLMFMVWQAMITLKIDALIDTRIRSNIVGVLTEYAIVAAIVALPIKEISTLFLPLITMCFFGIVVTFLVGRILSKHIYTEHVVEQEMAIFGTSTGVFLTGLTLLRICDPNLKSSILNRYSLAYAFNIAIGAIILDIMISITFSQGSVVALKYALYMILVYAVMILGIILYNKKLS